MKVMATWQKWMVVGIAIICAWMVLITGILLVNAQASEGHSLTVDGVTYTPSKVVGNGPTVHYYTPGTTPSVAYTERHTWTGNGSNNLPCDGRLHWIDNSNVLTISHCESETGSTTTTVVDTTTTTLRGTTTTVAVTSTTRTPGTSTTMAGSTTSTTTGFASTTTLCNQDDPTLPCGGIQTGGGACAVAVMEGAVTCEMRSSLDALVNVLAALILGLGLAALVSAMVLGRRK